jgi:SAM-dependent methyltransferase
VSTPAREPAPSPGIDLDAADRAAAAVARLLPPSLVEVFDARFARSDRLFDEFVYRLALHVFAEAKLHAALGDWRTAGEVVARAGLDPPRAVVPVRWLLRHLAARGALERRRDGGTPAAGGREPDGAGEQFRAPEVMLWLDPAPVLEAQRAHDPACLPSYTLAETAARDYPAFLRGEKTGDQVLLAPPRLPQWVRYFSNDNPLYAVNNRVGAVAVEAWMPAGGGAILEVGGGLASGAIAALERLAAAGRLGEVSAYTFTELVPAFLSRAQRLLHERFGAAPVFSFAPLDMNRSFAEQGVEPESVGLVYAVNTLHVAHDLAFTLGEMRRALRPGGRIVAAECVRPFPEQTLYPEFVFNLMDAFRAPRLHPGYRPNGGFLTPEQWTQALVAAGFEDVGVLPDVARIREVFPTFFVAALGATRPA